MVFDRANAEGVGRTFAGDPGPRVLKLLAADPPPDSALLSALPAAKRISCVSAEDFEKIVTPKL